MTAAAGDLCVVADVESFLSLSVGQDSALLQALITSASAFIVGWCARNFVTASYSETHNGQGNDRIKPRHYPITAVASVMVDGISIPQASSATASGYVFNNKWVYLRDYTYNEGVQNVTINYTAGYDQNAIPRDLAQACVEIVSAKYKRRLDLHISSKVLDGQQITFSMADVPASTKTTLQNYSTVYIA